MNANKWAHCCWSQPAKALPYMTTCYNAKDCLCPNDRHLNLSRHWLERSCASSSPNSSWAAVSVLGGRFAPGFNHKQWAHSFASAPKDATHLAWTRARALQTKAARYSNALFRYYAWLNTFQSYVNIGVIIWCACRLFILCALIPVFIFPSIHLHHIKHSSGEKLAWDQQKKGNIHQHPIWKREKRQAILSKPFPV